MGNALAQDIRYALRGMRRNPVFTAVAVISLALGIGANTAIFSLVETIMLRSLPVRHPEQLVELLQEYPGEPRGNGYWSQASYEHFRDHNHVFSALTGTSINARARFAAEGREPETIVGEYALGDYFSELGIAPALGRAIGPEDTKDGAVAVLSWSMWTERFGRDPRVLGKRIVVQDAPVTVIGVAPRGFTGLRVDGRTDVWLPRGSRTQMGLTLIGRLKPGMTLEQARAEAAVLYRFTIAERAASSSDAQVRNLKVHVEPAGAGLATVRDRVGRPLLILMAIVGVLLLLACVNIASMVMARAAGRRREMAVRISVGAGRGRLVRQALTESLMLSAAGTLAGAAVAAFGVAALLRILASGRELDRVTLRVEPDLKILAFTAAIALAAALIFGLAPAWSAFRSAPADALRQSGRSGETPGRRLLGKALVSAQVALSVVLLSAAGLFVGNLANLKNADLGFRRDHVLLVTLDPSHAGYARDQLARAYQDLLPRLENTPGVRSVSLSAPTPISGAGAAGFATAEGFQERPEDRRYVAISWIAPKCFQTFGIPLLAGRDFRFEDASGGRVAIVNQALARHYFSGASPIGRHITLDHVTGAREARTYEIVGVAGDANYYEIREPAKRAVYLPAFQDGGVIAGTFVIRTNRRPESVAADVRLVVHESIANVPVARITTLDAQIDASIVPDRMVATLSGFFGALGALLAGIGVYGLLAYTVARRTGEIGIRMALGATAGRITRIVLGDALAMVAGGLAVGAPLALWGRSFAVSLIPDLTVKAATPLFAGAAAMVAVALVASYVPARRAARVDPLEALRHE